MRKLFIILGIVVLLSLVLVLVLRLVGNDNGVVNTAPTEISKPKIPEPTQEQLSGNYSEPLGQGFSFSSSASQGNDLEVALDTIRVQGLNKASSTVTYAVTINDPRAKAWAPKRFALYHIGEMKRYPMKGSVTGTKGSIVTMALTASGVPSSALLANQIALSMQPPGAGDDMSLLIVVPERARPLPVSAEPEAEKPATGTTKQPAPAPQSNVPAKK
jgi:hypothetical protein